MGPVNLPRESPMRDYIFSSVLTSAMTNPHRGGRWKRVRLPIEDAIPCPSPCR